VPLSGPEVLSLVQNGVSKQAPVSAIGQNGASSLLVTANPNLPNSRVLVAGVNITLTDGGPSGNLVIAAVLGASSPIVWNGIQSNVLITGNNNDLALGASISVLRITPNAAGSNLTGIAAGVSGRILLIFNIATAGGGTLTLPNQSPSSLAANRFTNVGDFDVGVMPGGHVMVWYDITSATWRSF
jgi:hypothetical protein